MQPRWYVVHCLPQQDRQVERHIMLHGTDTFAPRICKTRKRNGNKPLFPGYVFVRLVLKSGTWADLKYMPGVRSLIEVGGEPCPVDDAIVEEIRRRAALYSPAEPAFSPGDRITVSSGPFAYLDGIFSESLTGDERIAVLIDMMHRQVRVELEANRVKPAVRGGKAA
jgi:transcriptional antiterminator RfaH